MRQRVLRLCTMLLASTTRMRLYGQDHRLAREACATVFELVQDLIHRVGSLRIEIRGDELHCADQRFDAGSGSVHGLVRRLSNSGIGLIEFKAELTPDELAEFCAQLADPLLTTVRSQPNVILGTAELGTATPRAPTESLRVRHPTGLRNDPLTVEASHLVSLHERLRGSHEIHQRDFRDIVLSLMSRFSEHDNIFLNLAEVRNHNLFTYLHTCNVATLSIGFSLGIGVDVEEAFDLGVAALLHDIGKNLVPSEILDKAGRLTDEEWEIVKMHPEWGARMQLQQSTVNHLAVVVAYEHHLHYNRIGGYPRSNRGPSRPSQLIAITDTFDALFGKRSYHDHFDVVEAIEILNCDSGTVYSPELVDRFTRFVNVNLEAFDTAA